MYVGLCALVLQDLLSFPLVLGYAAFFLVLRLIVTTLFLGHLKGNAIKIDEKQFPEIFTILKEHCKALDIDTVPDVYLLQGNGMLNAFAARLARRNVVVLYSDILEVAYQEGMGAISFIIGHELGHIKRNHVSSIKSLLIWPASWIPFLNLAYSRACEYTCDNVGYALCPKDAAKGLLVLGAGKKLYKQVSIDQLLYNKQSESGFATGFAEMFSTHPTLLKRVAAVYQQDQGRMVSEDQFYMSAPIESQKEAPR